MQSSFDVRLYERIDDTKTASALTRWTVICEASHGGTQDSHSLQVSWSHYPCKPVCAVVNTATPHGLICHIMKTSTQ